MATFVVGGFVAMSPANAVAGAQWANLGNGLCLTATGDSGAPVVQTPCDTVNRPLSQQWDISGQHFFNVGNGLCMDAQGGATNGTKIITWPCNSISNENWSIPTSSTTGFVAIRSRVFNTNSHCLDVPQQTMVVNTQLQIWSCNGTVAQGWYNTPTIIT
jgi:hypothetical protein